jgi:hypothetical protein
MKEHRVQCENDQSQNDGSAKEAGIAGFRGHAGPPSSRCSNVIRQPSEQLLGLCVGKSWDSHCKGESTSFYKGGFSTETISIVLVVLFLLGGGVGDIRSGGTNAAAGQARTTDVRSFLQDALTKIGSELDTVIRCSSLKEGSLMKGETGPRWREGFSRT